MAVIIVTRTAPREPETDVDIDRPELEHVTGYEDDDALVICDTTNPRAWIRSADRAVVKP